jgi:uncharacterized protein YutE (UPF0331/DUF86 family)
MIDRELVTRKVALIMRDLTALAAIAAKNLDAYLASPTDQPVAERYLERMIGRMIDINYHLLTESGQPPPPDYHASFARLADIGTLDREFASRIALCAGLRNRIAHEYDDLDPTKMFAALRLAVVDIPRYLAGINDFVSRRQ